MSINSSGRLAFVFACAVLTHASNAMTLTETQRLGSPRSLSDDFFGTIGLHGNLLAIGSAGDRSSSHSGGGVYVYEAAADRTWKMSAHVPGFEQGAGFGGSIGTDGHSLVIAASASEGTTGAAYFYRRDEQGAWQRRDWLIGDQSLRGSYNYFGCDIDMTENRMIIGALGEPVAPRFAPGRGAAYIYESNDQWQTYSTTRLIPASKRNYHDFGISVAVDDNIAVVGAPGGGYYSARAYIFQRTAPGQWQQTAELIGSGQPHSRFGTSVAVSNGVVVIGDPQETTIDYYGGAAYVFEQASFGNWQIKQRLQPSDPAFFFKFGAAVEIEGTEMVIGAPRADGGSFRSGAAYRFEIGANGEWQEQAKLISKLASDGDGFGGHIAIGGDMIAIGAIERSHGGAFVYLIPEPTTGGIAFFALAVTLWRPHRNRHTCSHSKRGRPSFPGR